MKEVEKLKGFNCKVKTHSEVEEMDKRYTVEFMDRVEELRRSPNRELSEGILNDIYWTIRELAREWGVQDDHQEVPELMALYELGDEIVQIVGERP